MNFFQNYLEKLGLSIFPNYHELFLEKRLPINCYRSGRPGCDESRSLLPREGILEWHPPLSCACLAVAHTFPPLKVLRYIAAMCYISLYICPNVARWHKIIAYEDEVNMVINLKEVENSGQS
jgi:hypothetical protein